jgi:two-component system phosphate regulon response regulator PhoB
MPTVWVVDDEPLIRRAILAVLDEAGYQGEGFGDAAQFYRRLIEPGQPPPDLLILDQMLPDEDGASIVHTLRERAEYRDIPVLFLTAVGEEGAERLRDLAPVMRKPFDFRDLISTIEALTENSAGQGPSRAAGEDAHETD